MKSDEFHMCPGALVKPFTLALLLLLFFACDDQVLVSHADQSSGDAEFALQSAGQETETGRYIVVLDLKEHPKEMTERLVAHLAQQIRFHPDFVFSNTIQGFAAPLSPRQVAALESNEHVIKVTPDVRISLFPDPEQSGMRPQHHRDGHEGGPPSPPDNGDDPDNGEEEVSTQVIPWGVERVGGPLVNSGRRAWVIDTGIDLNHEDLNVNTSLGKNCVTRGRDTFHDGNGHGTHVAGTIAAIDNLIDVIGVSESTEVIPVRVLDNSGSGFLSWVICGVDHVAGNFFEGDVANMSLGARTDNTSLDDAVISAAGLGLLFAIAAGNSGADASDFSPARTGSAHGNIFTVAALNQSDEIPTWSNFGEPVSHAAPGVGILSTKRNGGTETMSGTSMAAPHVAAQLLLEQLCDDGSVFGPDGGDYLIAYACDEILVTVE